MLFKINNGGGNVLEICLNLFLFFALITIFNNKTNAQKPVLAKFKVTKSNLGSQENLNRIFFTGKSIGWVLGQHYLYKTQNNGLHWKKIPIKMTVKERPSKIFFTDANIGWIILQKKADLEDETNYFRVLKTTNGGMTWKNLYVGKNGIIRDIIFLDKNTGWLVGFYKRGLSTIGHKYLMLKTTDQGQTWKDFATHIQKNSVYDNSSNSDEKLSRNAIINIAADYVSSMVIFLNNNIILKSVNNGDTWEKPAITTKLFSGLPFRKYGITDTNTIWFLGGRDNIEGTYSEFFLQKENGEVLKNSIVNTFFNDVIYVNNKFIAVGRQYSQKTKQKEAVIILLNPVNDTWEIIYKNSEISDFNSIYKISNQDLWVAGEKGELVHLETE